MSDEMTQGGEATPRRSLPTPGARRMRLLSEQIAHLDQRVTDEAQGVEGRLRLSLEAEVDRLEGLLRATNERIDDYMGALAAVTTLAAELEVRLQEVAELREQPRQAERAEARRLAALEVAVGRLTTQGGPESP